MWSIIDTGLRVIALSSKSIFALDSALRARQLWSSIRQKGALTRPQKIELCTEMFFTVLQCADVTVGICRLKPSQNNHLLKSVHLITSGGTSLLHVGKEMVTMLTKHTVTSKDWNQLVGIVLLRLGDMANTAASHPHYDPNVHHYCELSSVLIECLGNGLMAITHHQDLRAAASLIAHWAKKQFKKSLQLIEKAERVHGTATPIFVVQPAQNQREVVQHFENVYLSLMNWQTMQTIPQELSFDLFLKQFKCNISGNCIRHIVCPINHIHIHYEEVEINRILAQKSMLAPPAWPVQLEFNKENVIKNDSFQFLINDRLQSIADEWRNMRENPN